ncbi:1-phosphofructokinase family hexose kinase [Ignavigranum ruoffiae]|uniref:1-phosphofructokinase family hexose kinase n=1 Tax=Ignavigranum ruoffiae TaxID=89093 RepID=UPI003B001382
MILSITLNPTFDYIYFIDHFKIGGHNRFKNPLILPGGKGINMARAVGSFSDNMIALATLAGYKGKLIEESLKKENFNFLNFEIEGESRNAITIMHDDGKQTEIVEEGPIFKNQYTLDFLDYVQKIVKENTIKIISINGSVNAENNNFYLELLTFLRQNFHDQIKIIMDISGEQLKTIFQQNNFFPDIIKPNLDEFNDLFNTNAKSKKDILKILPMIHSNIETLLISCGSEGAIVKHGNKFYDVRIPTVKILNPTGSGDSTIAGIAYALSNKMNFEDVIKYGMAFGISNCLNKGVGEVIPEQVYSLIPEIQVNSL